MNGRTFFHTLLMSHSVWRDKSEVDLTDSIKNADIMKSMLGFICGKSIGYTLLDVVHYVEAAHFLLFDELGAV